MTLFLMLQTLSKVLATGNTKFIKTEFAQQQQKTQSDVYLLCISSGIATEHSLWTRALQSFLITLEIIFIKLIVEIYMMKER